MYAKKLALAALFVATATGFAGAADLPVKAVAPVTPPPFFFVNDNAITYYYAATATNPGAGKTPKNVFEFTHFDVWQYGTNFFLVDLLKATSKSTPAGPCIGGGAPTTCDPYTEIYGLFRSTFGFNEIFGTKAFSIGPMTDVSLMVGADVNTDNSFLESAKRSIEAGLTFSFAAPYKGFINLSPNAYHERQYDGFSAGLPGNPSGAVDFNTTWGFEWLYVQPLGFLPPSIPLTNTFFGTIHGPKGTGEPVGAAGALTRTTEEYLEDHLSLDVGKMIGKRPGMLSVWAGYRWWNNKFGINPNQPFGPFTFTRESTWLTGVTMAF